MPRDEQELGRRAIILSLIQLTEKLGCRDHLDRRIRETTSLILRHSRSRRAKDKIAHLDKIVLIDSHDEHTQHIDDDDDTFYS